VLFLFSLFRPTFNVFSSLHLSFFFFLSTFPLCLVKWLSTKKHQTKKTTTKTNYGDKKTKNKKLTPSHKYYDRRESKVKTQEAANQHTRKS